MSLTAVYERFIASPNPLSLAENASLHYIPTLISHSQPGPIIRHLESQNKNVVTIKSAKTISSVEGQKAISVEVDTTLEFVSGGGAYLPGLENFVVDKIATLPITHVVLFDRDQKISQIRISWDQGSLLKQTDVIGSRGRNWPVVDGRDQIRLIASSESGVTLPIPASPTSPRGRAVNETGFAARNPSPNKKHIKDPYASLDLFGPPKPDENRPPSSSTHAIAPRASAKPPPREMSELFAAGHEDLEEKEGSPKKSYADPAVAPKGAGSRKFGADRIFGEDENIKPPNIYKTNPARYNHFDLGDPDDNDPMQYRPAPKAQATQAVPMRAKTDKHGSQWEFSDLVTPAKVPMKIRAQDKVNVNWEEEGDKQDTPGKAAQKPRRDANPHFELKDDGTPIGRHAAPKPRKDAQTHFAMEDEPTPAPRSIIARTDAAKALYQGAFHAEDEKAPLSSISANARTHDFGNHWEMTDDAPATANGRENKGISDNRKKAVEMMDSHWWSYDKSPDTTKRPTSKEQQKKGLETHWSTGEGEEQPAQAATGRGAGGKKGFWDF